MCPQLSTLVIIEYSGRIDTSTPSSCDVSAPAVVTKTNTTKLVGVQARAYDIYPYLKTLQVQILDDPEITYGKPANTNSNSIRQLAGSPNELRSRSIWGPSSFA